MFFVPEDAVSNAVPALSAHTRLQLGLNQVQGYLFKGIIEQDFRLDFTSACRHMKISKYVKYVVVYCDCVAINVLCNCISFFSLRKYSTFYGTKMNTFCSCCKED